MPHLIEPAASGRAKCRGCARSIERGALRFGERLPNPYGDGEMTLWFHPLCAAYKRPEPLLQSLAEAETDVPDRAGLERAARATMAHPRLSRLDSAERAPSGQAMCRSCRQPVARGGWRIRLVFYEEGVFSPGGYVHLGCRQEYFGRDDLLDRLLHFSPALSDSEREELRRASTGSQ